MNTLEFIARRYKWQRTLTLAQLRHMAQYQNTLTLRDFRRTREEQKRIMEKEGGYELCFECLEIERRLKLAGVLK